MIFNFYVYDKNGNIIYYKEWNRKRKPTGSGTDKENLLESHKLMYGLIFSLQQFVTGIAPKQFLISNS
jgi:hypothetical protein